MSRDQGLLNGDLIRQLVGLFFLSAGACGGVWLGGVGGLVLFVFAIVIGVVVAWDVVHTIILERSANVAIRRLSRNKRLLVRRAPQIRGILTSSRAWTEEPSREDLEKMLAVLGLYHDYLESKHAAQHGRERDT